MLKNLSRRVPKLLSLSMYGWAARILIAGSSFVSVRMAVDSIGVTMLGQWIMAFGIAGWFSLIELGIGNPLQNKIASVMDDKSALVAALKWTLSISKRFFLPAAFVLAIISWPMANWMLGDSRKGIYFQEPLMVGLCVISVVFASLGALYNKVLFALGESVVANSINLSISLLTILLLLAANVINYESKFWLVGGILYVIPGCCGWVGYFFIKNRVKKINVDSGVRFCLNWTEARRFWLFSFLAMCVLQVDYLVIAKLALPFEATKYNLVMRVFSTLMALYVMSLSILWPVCAKAAARGRIREALFEVMKYLRIALCVGVLFLIAVVLLRIPLFSLLGLEPADAPSTLLVVIAGVYWILRIWADTFAMVLQASGKVGVLLVAVPVQALITIILQVSLYSLMGVEGILLGLVIGFLATVVWLLPVKVLNLLK